jgi:hypothetical protein
MWRQVHGRGLTALAFDFRFSLFTDVVVDRWFVRLKAPPVLFFFVATGASSRIKSLSHCASQGKKNG